MLPVSIHDTSLNFVIILQKERRNMPFKPVHEKLQYFTPYLLDNYYFDGGKVWGGGGYVTTLLPQPNDPSDVAPHAAGWLTMYPGGTWYVTQKAGDLTTGTSISVDDGYGTGKTMFRFWRPGGVF